MDNKEIYEVIKLGVKENRTLNISVRNGLGSIIKDIEFEPYIIGDDTFQFSFAWGHLPQQGLFYRFKLENILSANFRSKNFQISSDACYQYAIEEEHFAVVDDFTNMFVQTARTLPNKE